jgi:hypothetical protein
VGTKDTDKFSLKTTKLYQIFEKYYGQFGELSEHVYSEYDQQNILSPQDTYNILIKIKMVIQRKERGVNDDSDTQFVSFIKILVASLINKIVHGLL